VAARRTGVVGCVGHKMAVLHIEVVVNDRHSLVVVGRLGVEVDYRSSSVVGGIVHLVLGRSLVEEDIGLDDRCNSRCLTS
jgi:hypothetical protein